MTMQATRDIADGYDLIIVDFDGTIATLSVDWAGLKRELAEALDRPFDSMAKGLAALQAEGDATALERYWDIVRRFESADPSGLIGNDAVIAFLRAARTGRSIAVFSSNARNTVQQGLDRLGIADCVDLVIGGDDVRHAKPDPEGLETIVMRFGVPKQRTLFIGNSSVDLEAGTAAGVRTVILEHGAFPDHA